MSNCIIPWIETHLFFYLIFQYVLLFMDDNVDEEREYFSNSTSSALICHLAYAWFFANFSLALLISVADIKKSVYRDIIS